MIELKTYLKLRKLAKEFRSGSYPCKGGCGQRVSANKMMCLKCSETKEKEAA